MRISTKGRYAMRLMLDLAINGKTGYLPLREIAMRQEISDKYMEQIITRLVKAGFVRSVRGAQGGYCLSESPEKYTVGMILRSVEGSLSPVPCLDDSESRCSRAEDCVTMEVWQKLKDAIDQVVDETTLADMLKRYHEKQNAQKEHGKNDI